MKRRLVAALAVTLCLIAAAAALAQTAAAPAAALGTTASLIALPKPDVTGKVTLDQAIAQRRSVREYAPGALTLAEVSQLMWVAQGITGPDGKRATPSARAVYPLQVWLVANDVTGLPAGIYRYQPKEHALAPVAGGTRDSVIAAARGQASVKQAAAVVAVVGGFNDPAARPALNLPEGWMALALMPVGRRK